LAKKHPVKYFVIVKRFVSLWTLVILGTLLFPHPAFPAVPFSARAEDGLVLKGSLYLPASKEARPVVILLPMMANDRKSWGDFPARLAAAGYVALAMDQRGHGESVWKGKNKTVFSGFTNGDFARMVTDIGVVLKAVSKNKKVDAARAAVFGASIGANAALVNAASNPAIQALALLSPGLDYKGITTPEAAAAYGNRPALIAVAKGDNYAAMSSDKLAEKLGASATLKIYDGSQHGTRLFQEQKDFGAFLLDWTKTNFPVLSTPAK
jgi:dienelactone hydrolase